MTDNRTDLAGQCVRVLQVLLELTQLSISLATPGTISLHARLASGNELAIDLYVDSEDSL